LIRDINAGYKVQKRSREVLRKALLKNCYSPIATEKIVKWYS
jgi:hypothetical protein